MISRNPEDKVFPSAKFKTIKALNRYRNLILWLPISRIRSTLPWGYVIDPNNSKQALPDDKARQAYIKAVEYLGSNSYQVVADWLTSCGYKISDDGLINMIKERPLWPEVLLPIEERSKL